MNDDTIKNLAREIGTAEPTIRLRIGVITALEGTGSYRVKTDQTDAAWISADKSVGYSIGDRVWMIQQGGVFVVAGRLSGAPLGVPIGTILPYAGSTPPPGWLKADGSAISRSTYATLFAATGTAFGAGNGTTTFNIPDLDDRVPVGGGFTFSHGDTGGAMSVTLSVGQMPAHNHGTHVGHNHSTNGTGNATVQSGSGATVSNNTAGFTGATAHTHDTQGSGDPIDNMPPYVAMLYIIRAL